MSYLLERVRQRIADQYNANADAARQGNVQDWSQYRNITGWIAGADFVLQAVEEVERERGA